MHRAAAGERRAQHFLRAGLADRSGDSRDMRLRARARSDAQPLHGAQRVFDRENRPQREKIRRARGFGDHGRGACFEGAGGVVMAVMNVALDRNEEIAGLQRACVDGYAPDPAAQRSARRAQGARQLFPGP